MKNIKKIVITGGPCAGKSTALSSIRDALEGDGYTVLLISETATELISGGVAPWTCASHADYQSYQMMLQRKKEEVYTLAAEGMASDRILIVCDRGALDNKAYITNEEYELCLERAEASESELLLGYDAVFHLMTAAKGTDAYSCDSNPARTETPEEAVALDDALLHAWSGHPYFRSIDNSTDLDGKIDRLISEIRTFLSSSDDA